MNARTEALNHQSLSGCYDAQILASQQALRPGLFADSRLYVSATDAALMAQATAAIERVVSLPAWADAVLGAEAARQPVRARGVCVGVDFHLTPTGPILIEVNTNAGGAFVNTLLLRAQQGWPEARAMADRAEAAMVEMFRREWQAEGRGGQPALIALVDETPTEQFLYPDFLCAQALLNAAGMETLICAPEELSLGDGALMLGGRQVDLVYNRLTDFALDHPSSGPIRAAWAQGTIVLTPHPQAHALYADKRNLVRLSDNDWLASIGVDADDREILARVVPLTEPVLPGHEEELWARRKVLFFKPVAGYGGKAVYRGMNVTRKVFGEIMAGDYVAQTYAPPSLRVIKVDGAEVEIKCDLRCYAYAGEVQLMAARLWQGQTTNFRTPGGGFAPVVIVQE